MVGYGESADIGRGSEEVGGEALRVHAHHIIGDLHGEGLGQHGVEREEVDGVVVVPVTGQGIGALGSGEGLVGTLHRTLIAHVQTIVVIEGKWRGIRPGIGHAAHDHRTTRK